MEQGDTKEHLHPIAIKTAVQETQQEHKIVLEVEATMDDTLQVNSCDDIDDYADKATPIAHPPKKMLLGC